MRFFIINNHYYSLTSFYFNISKSAYMIAVSLNSDTMNKYVEYNRFLIFVRFCRVPKEKE